MKEGLVMQRFSNDDGTPGEVKHYEDVEVCSRQQLEEIDRLYLAKC